MSTALNWHHLLAPGVPFAASVACSEGEIDDFVLTIPDKADTVARIVRGQRCLTANGLFQEWAAALQFPGYFGENWDAFEECLAGTEWLPMDGLVVFISHADRLLESAPDDLQTFVGILSSVAAERAAVFPASPFRCVFQADPDCAKLARTRLVDAGLGTIRE